MAELREFVYKDKQVTVAISRDSGKYVGVVEIEGMTLSGADKIGAASASEDAAFELCKRRAQEMIDRLGKP